MSRRWDVCVTISAAIVIIGCSLSALRCAERRRAVQKKSMEQAVQTWEDEGGLVALDDDEAMAPASG